MRHGGGGCTEVQREVSFEENEEDVSVIGESENVPHSQNIQNGLAILRNWSKSPVSHVTLHTFHFGRTISKPQKVSLAQISRQSP